MHTKDIRVRDPFVFAHDGLYLLIASVNEEGRRGVVAYESRDLIDWSEPRYIFRPDPSFWGRVDFWAPELHKYRDEYYLLCSFRAEGRNRATSILKSASPTGPFEPWGAEQITPRDWMALDGTLHTDPSGRPWMVFCHEWVQIRNGGMCAIPLKPDLSGPDGEPAHLFSAGDLPWVRSVTGEGNFVTDGPFLYAAQDQSLHMLWSTFCETGYAVAHAASPSGNVLGPWLHDPEPVYPADGGHCMLFTGPGGVRYMSLHSPNRAPLERALFLPVDIGQSGAIRVRP